MSVRAPLLLCAAALAGTASAAPPEIRVFTDELAAPGTWTIETHANTSRAPAGARGRVAAWQLMPELSYGVARGWELSLQLPFARSQGQWSGRGTRVELQYVAPHETSDGGYWGFNVELAHERTDSATRERAAEALLVLGYRAGPWHLVANPGIELDRDEGRRRIEGRGAFKASRRVADEHRIGAELYLGRRAGATFADSGERAHRALYLVYDARVGDAEINVGIGRGLDAASDRVVLKMIVEWPY